MKALLRSLWSRHPAVFLFVVLFSWALVSGVLVQKWIAPTFLPDRSVDGMVLGLDGAEFHRAALEQYAAMKAEGWGAWEWNPTLSDYQPAGLASALYYLTVPDLVVLIPFNALVHGLGGCVLWWLLRGAGFTTLAAAGGAAVFGFFPSTLTWVAQLHKDGVYLLGFFLAVAGAHRLTLGRTGKGRWLIAVGGMWLGGWIAGTMRDYGVTLLVVGIPLATLAVWAGVGLSKSARLSCPGWRALGLATGLAGMILAAGGKGPGAERLDAAAGLNPAVRGGDSAAVERPEREDPQKWQRSGWLPDPVDRAIQSMVVNRAIFLEQFPESGSLVDAGLVLGDALDVILYLPRAVQIGLLAPFPADWFGPGASPTGTIQRRLAGVEMILSYLGLIGLGWGLWRLRRVDLFWFGILGLLLLIPLVIALPAVGSLYRIRFGPYLLLISTGWAVLLEYFPQCRPPKK